MILGIMFGMVSAKGRGNPSGSGPHLSRCRATPAGAARGGNQHGPPASMAKLHGEDRSGGSYFVCQHRQAQKR